jgi:predicted RNase H-like HicB family nuclease
LNKPRVYAKVDSRSSIVKIKIVVHEAEEGGFWAEVPAIPGCATQGDSMEELMENLREAIEGCLSIEVAPPEPGGVERMLELPA